MPYDIIGDIHGCAQSLKALLDQLGYQPDAQGVLRHASRTAAFLGDFIDGDGPGQREVLELVQPMVEQGAAVAVMGNHELNAIGYGTPGPEGQYLRPHLDKNTRQHQRFLNEFPLGSEEHQRALEWFKTLPLWLELEGFRLIHACWDEACQAQLQSHHALAPGNRLSEALLTPVFTAGRPEFEALEVLLKGKEVALPEGVTFTDPYGHARDHIRVRWWDEAATTYRAAFMGPEQERAQLPERPMQSRHQLGYGSDQPPVFLGHYWMTGPPRLLARNVACVDYSVARANGKLVAYRWSSEASLTDQAFVWVDRCEPSS